MEPHWTGAPRRRGIPLFAFALTAAALAGSAAAMDWSATPLVSTNDEAYGLFGSGVTGIPDLNGDGFGDLAAGAYNETAGGMTGAGRIHVFSGTDGALIRILVSPNAEPYGRLADSLRGVPDVNGDGAGDILAGARGDSPGASPPFCGRAYVWSGANGSLLMTLASPNEQADGLFGDAVGTVPDLDGDGTADFMVNGVTENLPGEPDSAGHFYVFSGATGGLIHEIGSPNPALNGNFGGYFSGLADVDGDGMGDILAGAWGERPGGLAEAGRAYIFSGATGALLHTLTAPQPRAGDRFGWHVWAAPDLDGDGAGDAIVGAYLADEGTSAPDAGKVFVFSGATGELLYELPSPNAQKDGWFGYAVSAAPDVNGDGAGEVLVGARYENMGGSGPMGPQYAGRVHVFSGADGRWMSTFASPQQEYLGQFGFGIDAIPAGAAGPLTLVVGSIESPGTSPDAAGRAYLMFPVNAAGDWAGYE